MTLRLFSQQPQKIELLNADVSEYDETLNAKATRLIGNVRFRHQDAVMFCDSAYLYRDENTLEAFNNVKINQGDSMSLTGKRLLYDGNTKIAEVFEDVVMTDGKTVLHTSRLDYDMTNDIASYTDSAHIVDGDNILTSELGYYYSNEHNLYFRKDVLLQNPKYTMTADTLRYNTLEKTAYFLGPTYIKSSGNLIYCENGWYNTATQQSHFQDHSYLQTKDQQLRGDSVHYDRNTGIGKVFGNVSITDTTNKIIISGDYGEHHEITDSSWVTGHALMTQVYQNDSMFLHADTLMAIGNPSDTALGRQKKKNLYAFHNVRIFKNDLQGICDSLVYDKRDSTITMFRYPVLWSGLNQLTADSVVMQTSNSEIVNIYFRNNAFVCAQADSVIKSVDSSGFNQVRGKNMNVFLNNNKIYRINVNGNGQTIYYAKDKLGKNFSVNRADCSDLVIYVEENKVKGITLVNEPEGTLYPINYLATRELRLKGFTWLAHQRPISKIDLFRDPGTSLSTETKPPTDPVKTQTPE